MIVFIVSIVIVSVLIYLTFIGIGGIRCCTLFIVLDIRMESRVRIVRGRNYFIVCYYYLWGC